MSDSTQINISREEDYANLMKGVYELDFRGQKVPSDLVLIGEHAFPLVMNPRGQVLMAASRYGQGRLVVLGHEEYLTTFPALVESALIWLNLATPTNSIVGLHPNCSGIKANLCYSSIQTEVGDFRQALGVYVIDAYSVGSMVKDLVEFMKAGGGLLMAGQAWSWAKDHPKENTLLGFPGNKVSSVAGIYFSELCGELGQFPMSQQIPSSWLSVSIGTDFKEDLKFLLQGVPEFDISGGCVPSEVLAHGPLAFPIGTTTDNRAFIAGAYYGQGRVIVTTHESYLGNDKLATFFINAIRWLDEGRKGLIGVLPHLDGAFAQLNRSGLRCEKTGFKSGLSVFVCTSYSDEHATEIQNFVAEGGGLLIGGHAWYWAQSHSGQNALTDYPGNHILNHMGLSLLGNTLNAGCYKAPEPGKAFMEGYHFRNLLKRFASHVTEGKKLSPRDESCLRKLGGDCTAYLQMQAHDSAHYTSIVSILTDMVKEAGVPQVCNSSPVCSAKDHLLLSVGAEVYKVSPNPDALLPYIIKNPPVLPPVFNSRIQFSTNTAGCEEWISTGLYLTPGMRTYIAVPAQIVGKGWKVQIGCQTDNIGNATELRRAPVVHERLPVESEMIQVKNLWGGLIYIIAPPKSKVDNLEVIVQVAVQAPYYKSGQTSIAEWNGTLKNAPAPWAELEFENIILTFHSEFVRGIDRPDQVAELWDSIMRGVADLAAIPAKFPRKERFVADVQISHGFMHAGYPVMIQASSAPELVNPKTARTTGIWGAIHELGHNQQRSSWEFPYHTTECTCNLWSVYVHETVLGVKRDVAHPNMTLANRQARAQNYVKEGRNLSSWDMWIALETYMQLADTFGWDAFKKVFARYHDMQNVPNDNPSKMNLYADTFSNVVNQNLASFFKAWGWPIQPSLEQKLSNLPPWNDHPMARYG